MAKAAKTPQHNSLIDFLEELDSYICSLGSSDLVHIQTWVIRFVQQHKRKHRLTDEYVEKFTTGISTIIDILVAIDKKSKSLNIS